MNRTYFASMFALNLKRSLFALALAGSATAFAQTQNLGGPVAWQEKLPAPKNATVVLPEIDVAALEAEDQINFVNKTAPWRFGYEHLVEDDFNQVGQWVPAKAGRVWRINYKAAEALSMNVFFDRFVLAEGATVHIYARNGAVYDGAYTHDNNQPDGLSASIPMATNEITVEFFEPYSVQGQSELVVGHVVQGYREIGEFVHSHADKPKALNSSGACNYDTKCAELPGNPFGAPGEWDDQIRSTVMMLINGSSMCSAVLVNNTANDGTPYVLSANHCGTGSGGARSFMFGWESPTAVCAQFGNSSNGPTSMQINGAMLRANRSGSDFALWELSSVPPLSYNVYYAGWDRSGARPTQATGIHHPSGDVKKICREADSPYMSSTGGAQVWWVNNWEYGITEPGSSGSPLFDQNKRVVGQLYGGTAACSGTGDNGGHDYYGRFNVSWNAGNSASNRLSDWLDPTGSNPQFIDGYDPNAPLVDIDAEVYGILGLNDMYCNQTDFQPTAVVRNAGVNTLASLELNAFLNGNPVGSTSLPYPLASGETAEVFMPAFSVATSGALQYQVVATNPNGGADQNPLNDAKTVDFTVVLDGVQAQLSLSFDCWPNETSWDIRNSGGTVLFSGDDYDGAFHSQTLLETFCLDEGCYTFNIYDSYGDGLNGSSYFSCSVDGDYSITDETGNALVTMTAPNSNFGTQATHAFCIQAELPCEAPYPVVEDLTHEIQSNGVLLQWEPIPGSIGCQVQGGLAPSGGLQTFTTMGADPQSVFVSQNKFNPGKTYRWRVRCGCALNVVGNWSAWSEFTWPTEAGFAAHNKQLRTGDLLLFPNPVSSRLHVSVQGAYAVDGNIRVYNALGEIVTVASEISGGNGTQILNTENLSPGVYFLEMHGENQVTRGKFIKQ